MPGPARSFKRLRCLSRFRVYRRAAVFPIDVILTIRYRFHLYRLFVIPFTMNRACTITHDRPNAHTEESRPRSFRDPPPRFSFFLFFLCHSSATALLERATFLLLCPRSDGRGAPRACRSHEGVPVRLVNAGEHSLLLWAARLLFA